MSGIAIYWMFQAGPAIASGIQYAAPGIGAAVGSIGMMLSLMPVMFMFMMMFMMMSTMVSVFTKLV